MIKEDRRIRRTKQLLENALYEMVSEKEYSKITITDITEKADIGHRTFYRHYNNLDDLLASIIKARFQEFQNHMVPDYGSDAQEQNGTLLFKYVEANYSLFNILFKSKQLDLIVPELKHRAELGTQVYFKDNISDSVEIDLVINHILTSILSLIEWWLRNNMPLDTKKMGKIYANLIINATKNYITNR